MREKTDKRVIKTKAKLVSTFMTLIRERDFENLTVNDICEAADVRRATFYKHYSDKYDFFKYIVSTLRADFDRKWISTPEGSLCDYFISYAFSLVDFFDENDVIIKNIAASAVSSAMFSIVISENFLETKRKIAEAKGDKIPHALEVFTPMLVGGVFHTLLDWAKNGKRLKKEELKSELEVMIKNMTR